MTIGQIYCQDAGIYEFTMDARRTGQGVLLLHVCVRGLWVEGLAPLLISDAKRVLGTGPQAD
ncbi:hypothetical protein ACHAWF_002457 [Thalassiosira exigua]